VTRDPLRELNAPAIRHGSYVHAKPLPIECLKLHGSVNWFKKKHEGKPICVCENSYRQITAQQPVRFDFECQGDGYVSNKKLGGKIPLLVPPMLGKLALHSTVAEQWRRAVHAIRRARAIHIYGYSFPETD